MEITPFPYSFGGKFLAGVQYFTSSLLSTRNVCRFCWGCTTRGLLYVLGLEYLHCGPMESYEELRNSQSNKRQGYKLTIRNWKSDEISRRISFYLCDYSFYIVKERFLDGRSVKDIPTDSRHVNALFWGSVTYDASVQSGQNLDQKGVLGGSGGL